MVVEAVGSRRGVLGHRGRPILAPSLGGADLDQPVQRPADLAVVLGVVAGEQADPDHEAAEMRAGRGVEQPDRRRRVHLLEHPRDHRLGLEQGGGGLGEDRGEIDVPGVGNRVVRQHREGLQRGHADRAREAQRLLLFVGEREAERLLHGELRVGNPAQHRLLGEGPIGGVDLLRPVEAEAATEHADVPLRRVGLEFGDGRVVVARQQGREPGVPGGGGPQRAVVLHGDAEGLDIGRHLDQRLDI